MASPRGTEYARPPSARRRHPGSRRRRAPEVHWGVYGWEASCSRVASTPHVYGIWIALGHLDRLVLDISTRAGYRVEMTWEKERAPVLQESVGKPRASGKKPSAKGGVRIPINKPLKISTRFNEPTHTQPSYLQQLATVEFVGSAGSPVVPGYPGVEEARLKIENC